MPNTLIVGATRGLGNEILKKYASNSSNTVYGTSREGAPKSSEDNVRWLSNVDLGTPDAGRSISSQHAEKSPFDIVIVTAGYFGSEDFDSPDWDKELQMYKTSAMGPVFLVHHLVKADLLKKGSKLILISSESGSITLRHEKEGGGNYGHHASKAAENMVGKLLSLDLKERGIAVALVHPGFMRTEMTRSVGFDKFWDDGGAVHPDEAAESLVDWIESFGIEKTGTYWAPRGSGDIGTAEVVLGKNLPTPLELPW